MSTVDSWPTRADLFYVTVRFYGHLFCEQDAAYRFLTTDATTYHPAIFKPDDQGDYFACLRSDGVLAEHTALDLNSVPSNVGDAPVAA
ncbi:predicted protein [Pyrenophora tritici-repentis Pt-1C-BFP]|uniref:Uncharacterized protein n=1 Tax=Pyrenophora tritici-repentis (strain Pt-1C-BFP) TaxID=426418 RepID=B2WK40_PYRTR|nr:uncharacterized protein PTRG_10229 [Pyrenophora tritici-repentis Pt-1C-BFP]EDU43280.1 predicted protein [Pyrenophora tritici-repentis Pt-1C-BFP]